jgi:hypothetical protein
VIVALALVIPRAVRAHPIHTTLAELTPAADGSVTIRVRAFIDDFSAAVIRYAKRKPAANFAVSDADAARYLGASFHVQDARGHAVPLRFVSQRRAADVIWLELRSDPAVRPTGLRVLNTMLFELHADQVNIVRASYGTIQHTTLFSRGDAAKQLP